MKVIKRVVPVGSALGLLAVSLTVVTPAVAITTDKAELRGNELRLEGQDAPGNADITADGITVGSANGAGAFDIRFSPFSSATCIATISDGVDAESVSLDRCTPSSGNQSPTANAGPNQTLTDTDGNGSESVSLDGSGSSDPQGPIASYSWSEGGSEIAVGATPATTLAVGTHNITLTVTDSDGATATDTVVVTVDAQAPTNQPPVANAGPDQSITDNDDNGAEAITLDGTGSSDAQGPIDSYVWTEGGSQLATGASATVILALGSHTVTLTVTDSDGVSAMDTMTVLVNTAPPPDNQAPLANAGPDQTVIDAGTDGIETVTLDGSASTDPDGTIVSYEWSENGVPLGGTPGQGASAQPPIVANAVVAGTFDHLFESNQADPPGIVPNSFGGSAASAGDVNGDGFDDVVIGSEVWNANDFAEGAAIVFLGGPDGPVGTNPSNAHALIEMNQNGATVNDVSTAGDVNGDGFDDILVGSHFYGSVLPGTQLGVDGAVFVFHGGPNGITALGPAQADGAIFANQITSGMGDYVDSAGDVNGDGFGDILVSVPREGTLFPPNIPPNDRSGNYGAILVFHGGPGGITGTGFSDADAIILPYEDTGLPLPPVDAQVGQAAGAGDINGDGFDDIVVGGTELTVYFGGPNGIAAQDIFDADDRIFADPPLGVVQGIGGAGLGFVVDGAGDINNDGFADVIASVPTRQLNPGTVPVQEGAAYIFLGGPTGLDVTSVTQAHTAIFGTLSVERMGWTVAGPGDIDADGFDDVVISALHYAGSLNAEGVAYIYRGSAQGITATTIAQADSRLEASQSGATIHENRNGLDAQGAGDVNGDGFIDIVVGKAFYDNGELNEGAAFLYNGESFLLTSNVPPVPIAGPDQVDVFDVDADGIISVTVDGSASFDPDGSIVSYEWYMATSSAGTGEMLVGTGASADFELPLISPIAAFGHLITLVVTDDLGVRRGDTLAVFPALAPTTFEFSEFANLSNWTTAGDVTLGDADIAFPAPPHVLMRGGATLSRTFTPAVGTTGLDISFWARGDLFGPSDQVTVQASVDGGPFVDYFTLTAADVTGGFLFYGGSSIPISMSWWPNTASSVTLRFQSSLSTSADFWLASLTVRSIQAPTGGATNQPPTANAGPDQTVVDVDASGAQAVALDGSASFDTDGTIATFEWRNGGTTIGTTAAITSILPVGTHTLTLLVTDDSGASGFDTVVVTVQNPLPPGGGPTLEVDLPLGTHAITLTVTDDDGATASDDVIVTVQAPAPVDNPPTANAGPNLTVTDTDNTGAELVTLDGSGSSDPEGPIASYAWFEGLVQIAAGVSPEVPLDVGNHTLTLTVTDGDGATASDTVAITVDPFDPSTNQSPVANAGPDQTVVDQNGDTLEVVTFDGTASFDPDGTIVAYNWTLNGNPFGNAATFSVNRPIGAFVVTLTVTDNLGATASDTVVVTVEAGGGPPPSGDIIYVSSSSGGTVGGVTFADEDVLSFDTATGQWAMVLDGSDVGLGGAGARDVDAIHELDDGSFLLSIVGASTLPDIGAVDDSDIVRFIPSATGATTGGTFELYFDGSDVGLTTNGEDIDSVHVLADGDLLISTSGGFSVTGASGSDEDVLRFTPSSLGVDTSGTWAMHFDGSDVGLNTSSAEDTWGVWADAAGDLYLTSRGAFAVSGLTGGGADVFACTGHTAGGTTGCVSFDLFFGGAANGYGSEAMDGLHVVR